MKKRCVLTLILTALAGTALHFAYDLCPAPLVGLFAPVNESVWEHLKLLFWPFLAAGFVLTCGQEEKPAAWSGFLLAELLMPLVLLGIYYPLRAGFGVESVAVDIALYYLVLTFGFWLACRVSASGRLAFASGVLVILTGLYGAAIILFTLAPPGLPIFLANTLQIRSFLDFCA